MGNATRGGCLALVLLAGATTGRAAEVRYIVTNGGIDVGGKAVVHYFKSGTHTPFGMLTNVNAGWGTSGQPTSVPDGEFDVRITFEDGSAHKIVWFDKQPFAYSVTKTVELAMPMAELRYTVTNSGEDAGSHGTVHVYPAGTHSANGLRNTESVGFASSGQPIRLAAGSYDVRITFSDSGAEKTIWFDNQAFSGTVDKAAEIGLPLAELRYTITNGGADTGSRGTIHVFPAGAHAPDGTARGPTIGWTSSGLPLRLPAGTYDIRVSFEDGDAKKTIWFDKQALSGVAERTVEAGVSVTEVRTIVTNRGTDVKDKAQVDYYPAGKRDGNGVIRSSGGETVRLPGGAYDIRVRFADGAANNDVWLLNQPLSGTVEKTIDVGVAIAGVRYTVLNNGIDTGRNSEVRFYPAGHHEGRAVDTGRSGVLVRLPEGVYDVRIVYVDGDNKRDLWIDNQHFAGSVEKTVEIAVPVAEVHVLITAGGADTGSKGEAHFYPHGRRGDGSAGWARSGGTIRLPEGAYDIRVTFADGEIRKNLWLDNQTLTGASEQKVEIGAVPNKTR